MTFMENKILDVFLFCCFDYCINKNSSNYILQLQTLFFGYLTLLLYIVIVIIYIYSFWREMRQ